MKKEKVKGYTNNNMHLAKINKNDEFYTLLEDIEVELYHYKNHFDGKVVYCNCDDPYESNFFKYFANNFNYYVLETIAKYDNPILTGMTGLRDAGKQKSEFCSKRTVEKAFDDLISNAKFKYIFLSYNNEGLMSLETIKNIMSKYGEYSYFTKTYKRFKADKDENRNIAGNETIEYLHCLIKKD